MKPTSAHALFFFDHRPRIQMQLKSLELEKVYKPCLGFLPITSHNTCIVACASEHLVVSFILRSFNYSCFRSFKKIYFLLCYVFVTHY